LKENKLFLESVPKKYFLQYSASKSEVKIGSKVQHGETTNLLSKCKLITLSSISRFPGNSNPFIRRPRLNVNHQEEKREIEIKNRNKKLSEGLSCTPRLLNNFMFHQKKEQKSEYIGE
jgi:hypothetical protein